PAASCSTTCATSQDWCRSFDRTLERFRFRRIADPLQLLVFTQFRTENCFKFFLELLRAVRRNLPC
ncbi:MAG: hypothetical protein E5Y25_17305, partial [Mesorhizobium sp.]